MGDEDKTLTQEEFLALIDEKVKEALAPLTQVDRKYAMFPGMSEDDIKNLDAKERSLKFLKAAVLGDTVTALALSEGTGSEGGYLVPEEFRAEVIRVAEQHGIARRNCRIIPMNTDTLKVPKMTASVSVYWPAEKGAITESEPTFGLLTLSAKECAGICPLTNQLLEDAGVDILDFITTIFAEAIAKEEDKQVLVGTGAPIVGLLGHASVNVVTMGSGDTAFSKIDADDLLDLIDAVDTGTETNGKFYMHKNILRYIQKLKDTTSGQYIWQGPSQSRPGSIWNYSYELTDVMPGTAASAVSTKFVAFGDLKYTLFGDRKRMEVDVGKEATVGTNKLFEQNMKALRVVERVDAQIAIPTAFAVLKTAAS